MSNDKYFSSLREAFSRVTSEPSLPGRRTAPGVGGSMIEIVNWSPHWEVQFIKRDTKTIESWINGHPVARLDEPIRVVLESLVESDPDIILPCPLCGSAACLFPLHLHGEEEDWEIACTGCSLTSPDSSTGATTREEALKTWNKRAPLSTIVGCVLSKQG